MAGSRGLVDAVVETLVQGTREVHHQSPLSGLGALWDDHKAADDPKAASAQGEPWV